MATLRNLGQDPEAGVKWSLADFCSLPQIGGRPVWV